ncbi:protein phosphatase 1 regulatory subunit 37 [Hoplias malabaricus]|uniref:protein phosphatase 1 regulatory subunit 37 n=1 Tax=Hoplias malabaricus TaxID=27720 RepID=UPI0034628529
MNVEGQAVDLCNASTKSGVDTTAHISEEIIPRTSLRLMDGDAGRQAGDAKALGDGVMTRVTDCNSGAEDNHDKRGKEELFLQKNNGVTIAPTVVCTDPESVSSDNKQQESSRDKSQFSEADEGDMDIGVDLCLDESGVLESEPPTAPGTASNQENASGCTDGNPPISDADAGKESQKPSEAGSDGMPASFTSVEVVSPSPPQEEGAGAKHGAKRVTFPSDEEIVSGSVEPKDPWRHAQNVTVEEILSAYRQACQKLNCKPIPKVLKQIQDLTDLTQRNECLDLKGEKLDYKACESLEEIFKRVQFKVVDLEQTNLDEDGASALFDMIEYYESATHLNISFNKHIGTRGWQAAAHMMRKTSSLQYLDARNTPLLDHSAPFVARALRISGSLTVLHLENAGLSGRPLMLLATALKMNMNLRELYLADNKLNGLQDSAQLGNLLKFNYNIQILDLRNNHILDSGLAYVCEGLKEQRKGLVTLVLWNNQLTHNGMGYLAAALPCTQSLETLNLGHNAVGNEGVHKLKDGLIANRSVLRLGLASTKLSCEGAVAVAEFIAESPRLLRLDLRENEIKTGGLMALSLALKVNTSLLRLDLDREPKKETVKSFIETQRALLAEIQNGCKRNFVLAKEKEESQQVRQSTSMAEIATEEPPPEEEEEDPATAGDSKEGEKPAHEGDEDEEDSEKPATSQEEEGQTTATQEESDSDTDDDEDEDDVEGVKPTVQTSPLKQTPPPVSVAPPPITVSQTLVTISSPAPSPVPTSSESPAVVSSITVTQASVTSGAPPSPGRCISVSSPGRGHKIFMVTRVESPPEQQLLALAKSLQERAPESKTAANKPAELPSTKAPSELSSSLSSTSSSSSSQQPEQKHSNTENTSLAQQTSEEPSQTSSQPSQPEQTLAQPVTPQQPEAEVLLQTTTEQQASKVSSLELATVQQEQHQRVAGGEERAEIQTENDIPSQQTSKQVAVQEPLSEGLPENVSPSLSQLIDSNTDTDTDGQQLITKESRDTVKEPLVSQTEIQIANPVTELQPQAEKFSSNSEIDTASTESATASTPSQPVTQGLELECPLVELDGITSTGTEDLADSPDGSFNEEVECLSSETATLPNGLKPEFAFHLLEPETPKAACCVMEHMSVTAELSCGQDLEELLLEASLDTSRDTP